MPNLEVTGARVHNLKNMDVTIPRDRFVVITGLSGSGKSSLAFDTIYAEGQRRYIETFSAYARQFLGSIERPDVDGITGLSPVIAIEQKTISRNPRSTVGTVTEIYDFLRLLFARTAEAFSYKTGEKMVRYSDAQIVSLVMDEYGGRDILILAPLVKGRKGHYKELFEQVRKSGFLKVRVDGELTDIRPGMRLDRYKTHDVEALVDRIRPAGNASRLADSIGVAMRMGKGTVMIADAEKGEARMLSRLLMCPATGISYDEPAPNTFSFNSPYGACTACSGLGNVLVPSPDRIFTGKHLSVRQGGIAPIASSKNSWILKQIEAIAGQSGFSMDTPVGKIPEEALQAILYGTDGKLKLKTGGVSYHVNFQGIATFIREQYEEASSEGLRRWARGFMDRVPCPECGGRRLKKESLHFLLDGKSIADLGAMSVTALAQWLNTMGTHLEGHRKKIAAEVLKEISKRVRLLEELGLGYLTLFRSARTLSGGEAQRIRLATQIGSQLAGVLYILDEPSIGLHQKDNLQLIRSLRDLRDLGNSVIVVEHDKETIRSADYVLDIGPGAGTHGGRVVAAGTPDELLRAGGVTAEYLSGRRRIAVPAERRKGQGRQLVVTGARGHNLKNIDVAFPLGTLICVTGVSGSGKSSLVNQTLYPALSTYLYRSEQPSLPHDAVKGKEHIDKIVGVDQSPIGRTPRSNPATYTSVFTDIRNLFCRLPEALVRGYKPGRFSFNVKGGRCESCLGAGMQAIEMNLLPDVYVLCGTCNGKRYNKETLEVRFKGKSINDVLEMTVDDAVEFFSAIPAITQKIRTLQEVGLGYIRLGQQSTTLSGGEAQRVKLAAELYRRDTGSTLYILDEPTTGLHFEDVKILLEALAKLVDRGNTVIVIEHNLDVIKMADHIIDLGPEGGEEGGRIVCVGTPEAVAGSRESHTARYLEQELREPENGAAATGRKKGRAKVGWTG